MIYCNAVKVQTNHEHRIAKLQVAGRGEPAFISRLIVPLKIGL